MTRCIRYRSMKDLEKFQPGTLRGWTIFTRQLENFLRNLKGVSDVPLNYVTRKDIPRSEWPDDEEQRMIYEAPLYGNAYVRDNEKVYRIIHYAVSDTEAWPWIRDVRANDGRGAILKLRDHYDGPGMRTKRSTIAKKRIEQLHYKNEATSKFETYSCSSLKEAFDALHEDDRPVEDKERIDVLIRGIHCTVMTASVSNLRMNLTSGLVQPVFSTVVGILSKEVTLGQPPTVDKILLVGNKL